MIPVNNFHITGRHAIGLQLLTSKALSWVLLNQNCSSSHHPLWNVSFPLISRSYLPRSGTPWIVLRGQVWSPRALCTLFQSQPTFYPSPFLSLIFQFAPPLCIANCAPLETYALHRTLTWVSVKRSSILTFILILTLRAKNTSDLCSDFEY